MRKAIGVLATFVLVAIATMPNGASASLSTSPYKWNVNYANVDVSDPSWPSGWVTSLAQGMSAWNAAPSSWSFQSGATGHQFKVASISPSYLAYTVYSLNGTRILDADTTFNSYYTWSTTGAAGAYDVRSAATHELGHWLKLIDLTSGGDSEMTMYYSMGTGETKKQSLESDDIASINAMYP